MKALLSKLILALALLALPLNFFVYVVAIRTGSQPLADLAVATISLCLFGAGVRIYGMTL